MIDILTVLSSAITLHYAYQSSRYATVAKISEPNIIRSNNVYHQNRNIFNL